MYAPRDSKEVGMLNKLSEKSERVIKNKGEKVHTMGTQLQLTQLKDERVLYAFYCNKTIN